MGTARALTVSRGVYLVPEGVYLVQGGVCPGGVCPGGSAQGGCPAGGGVSAQGRCLWGVLPPPENITLPQTSFAGGKNGFNAVCCYAVYT